MSEDYSRAGRKCDIIMKGGITSGIVYPKAVCRLALEYRFRSIGGTSAGAIAAAATAAPSTRIRGGHFVG
jgi:predicted acylesterase/phospholipase RssA